MAQARHSVWKSIIVEVGATCIWCNAPLTLKSFSKEHIVPRMARTIDGDEGLANIKNSCKTCNNNRGRLHDFYYTALKFDLTKMWPNSVKKFMSRLDKLKHTQRKWVKIEKEKLGWSFTETLDFESLPVVIQERAKQNETQLAD